MAYEVTINASGEMDAAEVSASTIGYSLPISRINQIVQIKLAEISDEDVHQARATISEVAELVHEVLSQSPPLELLMTGITLLSI